MAKQVFEFVTIFPELVRQFVGSGLMGKAIDAGRVEVHATDPREFTTDKHRSVDDAPFGGGAGMVMMAEPVARAIESVEERRGRSLRVLVTPSAPRFDQRAARELATHDHITFLCGRYEGIDDRIREQMADRVYSLGDFVLNGGEVAALAMFEAVARLREGVLGNPESVETESFAARDEDEASCLEHPHYTRPAVWRGHAIPEVLRSGDHERVASWRERVALQRTHMLRPDLRPTIEALREAVSMPMRLVVLLPDDFACEALVADEHDEWVRWSGGRGRAPQDVKRVRELREARQELRREMRTARIGSTSDAPARVWSVELCASDRATPDALSPASFADLVRVKRARGEAPAALIFVLRWPGATRTPPIDARFRLDGPQLGSREAIGQKSTNTLAISAPLIDISQPASPQVGSLAAALRRSLGQ